MNESPNRRAVMVGLFVIVGLAFFLSGILLVGNLHETFKRKIKLVSLFDDVNGLQTGNNVWFSGVKVGTVKTIHFYDTSKVEVIINIDVKVQEYIRKDAKVKLSTDGLIGNKILIIYGGSRKSGEISEGDTLTVETSLSQEDVVNTLQESNRNLLSITSDLKTVSKKLASGEGTLGKLLNDNSLYDNLNATSLSLKGTSGEAKNFVSSLNTFSAGLNKKGTLANDLVTDTVVFNSMRSFALQLKQIGDTTKLFVTQLKFASTDPHSSLGVVLHDPVEAARIKTILKNLESSSQKLDEDLEAAQHSFLLKKYFKEKKRTEKPDSAKTNN